MAPPRRAPPRSNLHLLLALLPPCFCCLLLPRRAAAQPAPSGEAQLLLEIKHAWGDPSVLAGWNATAAGALCGWPFVTCDAAGRVANLTLANTNVTGPFPDAVGDLSSLAHLDVSNNNIAGAFPAALFRCRSLQYLNLSQNYFGGVLPTDIGGGLASSLTTLDLFGNMFNGTIPASLSGLRNLQYLSLGSNRFSGTVPEELGELTNLQALYLANNWFDEGKLPASFKNLTNLVSLWASECNFVGDFPNFVWRFNKLQELNLYKNNLTGEMVVDGFDAMSLTVIDVSENMINGLIPEVFGSLENLNTLNLFMNNFSGEIPASIGQLRLLTMLRVHTNRLNGTLPPELGKNSPGLYYIEADFNELTGAIPEGLCAGGQLELFTAKDNQLSGSIPAGLANCATLRTLSLDNNQLSGDVPEALWTATQLYLVTLQSNQLTGTLPATVNLLNLSTMLIGNNQFGGNVPAAAVALKVFTAENNRFTGGIPASLGDGMPLLQRLNLSGNQLSGEIPKSVGKLSQLTQMDLSRNQLAGDIPAEIGAMPVLGVLDLSSNKLSGNVPQALANPTLTTLNLSSNQLSGQVPAGFTTAVYGNSFLDNPGLCTAGSLAGVRSCGSGSQDSGSSGGVSHALRTGLLVAGAALLLVAAAFAFFAVRDTKKRRTWGFWEASIIRGLTEENLVGRGGSGRVYRVAYTNRFDSRADAVAVKQIRTAGKLDERLEREFETEARILGNLRHNNIVRLLCCLSSAESKLLVYEYMENGSLDKWLHHGDVTARARRETLDWPTRLRVAVGAAQGLCYMHHECEPAIVHRDVKASNILLDSEFRAKVADFGLARMLLQAGAPETMSAVAGSFGYMAPECAYTKKVNEKVDVYSFGVVLLELTTGREANDGGEHGSLAEWARHHYHFGGTILDATDKSISYAGYSEEIEVVFRLGVLCTAEVPSSRPTMKDVLQILVQCSEKTVQKDKTERGREYDSAPLLLPKRGSRRKQLSDGSGTDIEEKSDFDSIV
ncbi:unnamed protein product [Urochloa decumbens]|uniref:Protein kinase domain-containing protein n=1 Tax=Urochloa decumbens TaxID=240449 RepID=A0ABC8YR56_9POAL